MFHMHTLIQKLYVSATIFSSLSNWYLLAAEPVLNLLRWRFWVTKGKPQNFRERLQPSATSTFSSVWDFMMGFGKPQPRANFEVASFSRCRKIIGNPKILGSCHSPRPHPLFLMGEILLWSLANTTCVPNLKSLASAVAEILQGSPNTVGCSPSPRPRPLFLLRVILWWSSANHICVPNIKGERQKFWKAPPAKGHAHFSSGCYFMMGLGKPKLCTTFEVTIFSHCVNIEGESPNLG